MADESATIFRENITQKTMTVHCRKCNHQWESVLPLPMLIDRALKVMRGIVEAGCPNCGAYGDDVLCGRRV